MCEEDEEEELDTDLETDRLLGHQIQDDGFYEDKSWADNKSHRPILSSNLSLKISPKFHLNSKPTQPGLRHGLNTLIPTSSSSDCCNNNGNSPSLLPTTKFNQTRSLKTSPSLNSSTLIGLKQLSSETSPVIDNSNPKIIDHVDDEKECEPIHKNISESSEVCNLDTELVDSPGGSSSDKSKKDALADGEKKRKNKNKEGTSSKGFEIYVANISDRLFKLSSFHSSLLYFFTR